MYQPHETVYASRGTWCSKSPQRPQTENLDVTDTVGTLEHRGNVQLSVGGKNEGLRLKSGKNEAVRLKGGKKERVRPKSGKKQVRLKSGRKQVRLKSGMRKEYMRLQVRSK